MMNGHDKPKISINDGKVRYNITKEPIILSENALYRLLSEFHDDIASKLKKNPLHSFGMFLLSSGVTNVASMIFPEFINGTTASMSTIKLVFIVICVFAAMLGLVTIFIASSKPIVKKTHKEALIPKYINRSRIYSDIEASVSKNQN